MPKQTTHAQFIKAYHFSSVAGLTLNGILVSLLWRKTDENIASPNTTTAQATSEYVSISFCARESIVNIVILLYKINVWLPVGEATQKERDRKIDKMMKSFD